MAKLKRQRLRQARRQAEHLGGVVAAPTAALAPAASPPAPTPRAESNQALQRQLREGQPPIGLIARHRQAFGNRGVQRLLAGARQADPAAMPLPTIQRAPLDDLLEPAGGATGTLEPPTATGPTDLPPPATRRMIRQGSQGREVEYAQQRLNAHGAAPPLAEDGIFGPKTHKATVAYQKSHGLVPDAIIGPRTWSSLDGPTTLGGSSGGGLGGAGGPGSKIMEYDTGSQRFSPPTSGTTMDTIRAEIKAKQDQKPDPDLGPTVTVTGVTQGTPEEIFVWNILLQRAERKHWGSEIDVVTQIGPVPKGGGAAPVGQVTIRIDGKGNATADLLNRGPVAKPSTFKDVASAKAALKKTFGFSDVKDGTGTWSLDDLNKVHDALSRLPAADRAGLADVELVRDQTLTDDDGNPLAGEFRFEAKTSADGKSASRAQSLHLADLAFAADDIGFIGGKSNAAPSSFHTIVHEAAHAVESKALRDAQFARLQAQADLNVKIEKVNDAVNAVNPESKSAFATAKKYTQDQKKACSAYLTAVNNATSTINTFAGSKALAKLDKQEAAAAAAISARDAAKAKLPAGHPAINDFAKLSKLQDDWFTAAKERAVAFKAFKAAETAETNASGSTTGTSKRLQNFVDLVNKHKIPPLTEYARKNWPKKPGEFFAESYSFWLNDPVYLEANAKPIKDWFDAGEHLK